jgi:hypothetical protein
MRNDEKYTGEKDNGEQGLRHLITIRRLSFVLAEAARLIRSFVFHGRGCSTLILPASACCHLLVFKHV